MRAHVSQRGWGWPRGSKGLLGEMYMHKQLPEIKVTLAMCRNTKKVAEHKLIIILNWEKERIGIYQK